MKKIRLYITTFLVVSLFAISCDKDFDEINTSKTDFTSLEPAVVMNSAIISVTDRNNRNYLNQAHTIIQWIINPFGSSMQGANYNQWTSKQDDPWNPFYQNSVPRIVDVVRRTKDDVSRSNLYNAARIWKVYIFQQITDAYGDVPYFEAGLGFFEKNVTAVYDTQQAIYMDMLKELEEASAALDPAKGAISGEILYGGNVDRWKKFGYSMLLRTAMRLSKVDPATAETYAKKAIEGGVMESNGDNAWFRHTAEFPNRPGVEISGTEKGNYYVTKPFVDFLKSTNDPRLGPFTHRYVGAQNSTQQTSDRRTKDPAKQIGMPVGYNDITIKDAFGADGVVSIHDYSQFDWNLFFVNTSPDFHCTYGQTQLLLAEAIVRGWVTGDAAAAFENAVKADMDLLALFNSAATVPAADITAYITAHPLNTSTTEAALEQINNEYWLASFPNATEGWANFRRSGYPALAPNPYPGSEIPGEFIRRHKYPQREDITNRANLLQAINRIGDNEMNTRIWWDKK
ncbi:MAG: SusD/RagB family nutrient-binding outer membrane lipoprotein [Bacteroidales bacterium]|jgi:hypothetical protein|nr:SusD/RagB family nutrient-binding outer membrane lipoprotein [Bacteroidales bacterium]